MDRRIMFVVLGVAALALAGLAFAAGGQGWNATGFDPQNWNGTVQGHRMMRSHGSENATGSGMMRGNGTQALNMTARAEEMKQFKQAVLSDDYATAKQINTEYGVGGPIFGKLNETTFAKFSQIANLESQLRQELGLNATGTPPMMGGFGAKPFARGFMEGRQLGLKQGMHRGLKIGTNQTKQQ